MTEPTPFAATSITVYFDPRQDRLNLLFIDKGEARVTGMVTRRLLKGILQTLPQWLAEQFATATLPAYRRQVEQMNHLQAQQQVAASYDAVQVDEETETFLVETINLSKIGQEQIRLALLDGQGRHECVLVLGIDELHKLIGETLRKVPDWDIGNPWEDDRAQGLMH